MNNEDNDPDNGSHDPEEGPQTPAISIDATLTILSHPDRRYILRYLVNSSDQVATVDDLVDHLVHSTEDPPDKAQITTELHHVHLPKLTETGVLEYDPRSKQLRYYGDERLELWLERVEHEEQ